MRIMTLLRRGVDSWFLSFVRPHFDRSGPNDFNACAVDTYNLNFGPTVRGRHFTYLRPFFRSSESTCRDRRPPCRFQSLNKKGTADPGRNSATFL